MATTHYTRTVRDSYRGTGRDHVTLGTKATSWGDREARDALSLPGTRSRATHLHLGGATMKPHRYATAHDAELRRASGMLRDMVLREVERLRVTVGERELSAKELRRVDDLARCLATLNATSGTTGEDAGVGGHAPAAAFQREHPPTAPELDEAPFARRPQRSEGSEPA